MLPVIDTTIGVSIGLSIGKIFILTIVSCGNVLGIFISDVSESITVYGIA